MRLSRSKLCLLSLCVLSCLGALAQTNTWPTIQPVHEEHTVVIPNKDVDTPFLVYIKDVAGVSVYKLECHNGYYDDDSEIKFSGAFQCALFAIKGITLTSWNLLVADSDQRSTDWWNRGRMLSNQLRGECLAYPEYSTLRHFKMRGMLITFGFTNLGWSDTKDQQGNPLLEKFTFIVDVVPDKAAQSPTAEPATGPSPPTSCYP